MRDLDHTPLSNPIFTPPRNAEVERADVLAFLDREIAKSDEEVMLRIQEQDRTGATRQQTRAMHLRTIRNYIECGGHEGASR